MRLKMVTHNEEGGEEMGGDGDPTGDDDDSEGNAGVDESASMIGCRMIAVRRQLCGGLECPVERGEGERKEGAPAAVTEGGSGRWD